MTPLSTPLTPTSTPFDTLAAQLRPELNPSTQLEEMFFSQIVSLSVLGSFLMRHLHADPQLIFPETPRRMRMYTSNRNQLRYAYEELRRLQLARQIQKEDPEQADVPILAVVARHTTRAGYRAQRRASAPIAAPPSAPITRPVAPGRNATCPCGSGLKYKRCCGRADSACANNQAA